MDQQYTTNPGDLLAIWIEGRINTYFPEVLTSDPLVVKVQESGELARLNGDEIIIQGNDSAIVQRDERDNTCVYLQQEAKAGRTVLSGLRRLKVHDNQLRMMLPNVKA